jgi:hypothetical protein
MKGGESDGAEVGNYPIKIKKVFHIGQIVIEIIWNCEIFFVSLRAGGWLSPVSHKDVDSLWKTI